MGAHLTCLAGIKYNSFFDQRNLMKVTGSREVELVIFSSPNCICQKNKRNPCMHHAEKDFQPKELKAISVSKCAAQLRKAFPSTTRINKNDTGSFSSYSCKGRPISQKCGQIPVSFPFLRSIVFACSCIAVLLIYFLCFYRKSSYLKRLYPNFDTESL